MSRMLLGVHPLEIILRLALAAIGGLLTVFALWMTVQNVIIIRTHKHARAEVVTCERIGPVANKGLNYFYVQVRFADSNGGRTADVDRPNTKYEVGEIIDVYYMPETSYKVIAGDFMQMWFHTVIAAVTGFMMLFFGLRPMKAK